MLAIDQYLIYEVIKLCHFGGFFLDHQARTLLVHVIDCIIN